MKDLFDPEKYAKLKEKLKDDEEIQAFHKVLRKMGTVSWEHLFERYII